MKWKIGWHRISVREDMKIIILEDSARNETCFKLIYLKLEQRVTLKTAKVISNSLKLKANILHKIWGNLPIFIFIERSFHIYQKTATNFLYYWMVRFWYYKTNLRIELLLKRLKIMNFFQLSLQKLLMENVFLWCGKEYQKYKISPSFLLLSSVIKINSWWNGKKRVTLSGKSLKIGRSHFLYLTSKFLLTLPTPRSSESYIKIKIQKV